MDPRRVPSCGNGGFLVSNCFMRTSVLNHTESCNVHEEDRLSSAVNRNTVSLA